MLPPIKDLFTFELKTALETPQVVGTLTVSDSMELLGYGFLSLVHGGRGPFMPLIGFPTGLDAVGVFCGVPSQVPLTFAWRSTSYFIPGFKLADSYDNALCVPVLVDRNRLYGIWTLSSDALTSYARYSKINSISLTDWGSVPPPEDSVWCDAVLIYGQDEERKDYTWIWDNEICRYRLETPSSSLPTGERMLFPYRVRFGVGPDSYPSITLVAATNKSLIEIGPMSGKSALITAPTWAGSRWDYSGLLDETDGVTKVSFNPNGTVDPDKPALVVVDTKYKKIYRIRWNGAAYILVKKHTYGTLARAADISNAFEVSGIRPDLMAPGSAIALATGDDYVYLFEPADTDFNDSNIHMEAQTGAMLGSAAYQISTLLGGKAAGYVFSLDTLVLPQITAVPLFGQPGGPGGAPYYIDLLTYNLGDLVGQDSWAVWGVSAHPFVELDAQSMSINGRHILFASAQGAQKPLPSAGMMSEAIVASIRVNAPNINPDPMGGLWIGFEGLDEDSNPVREFVILRMDGFHGPTGEVTDGVSDPIYGTFAPIIYREQIYDTPSPNMSVFSINCVAVMGMTGRIEPYRQLSVKPLKILQQVFFYNNDVTGNEYYVEFMGLLNPASIYPTRREVLNWLSDSFTNQAYNGRAYSQDLSYIDPAQREAFQSMKTFAFRDKLYEMLPEDMRNKDKKTKEAVFSGSYKLVQDHPYTVLWREVVLDEAPNSMTTLQRLCRFFGLELDRAVDNMLQLNMSQSLLRAPLSRVVDDGISGQLFGSQGAFRNAIMNQSGAERIALAERGLNQGVVDVIEGDGEFMLGGNYVYVARAPNMDLVYGRDHLDSGIPFDTNWFDTASRDFSMVADLKAYLANEDYSWVRYLPPCDPRVRKMMSLWNRVRPYNCRFEYADYPDVLVDTFFEEYAVAPLAGQFPFILGGAVSPNLVQDTDWKTCAYRGTKGVRFEIPAPPVIVGTGVLTGVKKTGTFQLRCMIKCAPGNTTDPSTNEGFRIDLYTVGPTLVYRLHLQRDRIWVDRASGSTEYIDTTDMDWAHSDQLWYSVGLKIDVTHNIIDLYIRDRLWKRAIGWSSAGATLEMVNFSAKGSVAGDYWHLDELFFERVRD